MAERTSAQTRFIFFLFLLSMLPAAMALRPAIDEDAWWHLRVGETIVQNGSLPDVDPFSRIGVEEGAKWLAYSWMFEVAMYGSYRLGGLDGVSLFGYVLSCATFLTLVWFVVRRSAAQEHSAYLKSAAALALLTVAVLPLMRERPWHFTIIGTVLTLHAVERIRAGESWRGFWWLPLYYLLWANVHIQFVLGLGVIGLAVLCRLRNASGRKRLLALGALCVAATLVTPFHVRIYGIVWEYATQLTPLRTVTELMPPDFRNWWTWPLAALLVWACVAAARRGFPLWESALLLVGAIFSLRMQRDLWFGCLAAVMVIVSDGLRFAPTSRNLNRSSVIAVLAAFALVRIVWAFVDTSRTPERGYPAAAVRFVEEKRLPGPLFNHFDWGGYLIWNLRRFPVSIDGRTNFYGEERLARSIHSWAGKPGWEDDPELRAAGVIIAPRTQRLTELLLELPHDWTAVYQDDVAVVLVPKKL